MDTIQQDDTASLDNDTTSARLPPSSDMLGSLWSRALQDYQSRTGIDPRVHSLTRDLASCDSFDEILRLFDVKMGEFKRFRRGSSHWNKLRNTYLKPSVRVLLALNGILKDASDTFVRCIFYAYDIRHLMMQ